MSTIRMPQLGESVVEGTIGKWLVKEGQHVTKDQAVVEILTDKADSEINAPESGVVTKILAGEGATVAVGDGLCELDSSGKAASASASTTSKKKPTKTTPFCRPPSLIPHIRRRWKGAEAIP